MQEHWYVVYTKSRNEKKVVEQLQRIGIEAYCPLRQTVRKWSDRKKKVQQPLFPSYCFVLVSKHDRERVLQAPGVSRFVYWCGAPATVRSAEIEVIKRWLQEAPSEALTVHALQPGDRVRINSGEMMGVEAEVISRQGSQLVLKLPSIGYQVLLSAQHTLLEKVA